MAVNVITSTDIARPRHVVAEYTCNPDNATAWYENIRSVEWKTPRPMAVGSQVAFVAKFMGRNLSYTYEVVEWEPDARYVMRTSQGPFPMETTYTFADSSRGTTMTLRNAGEPSGFSSIMAGPMARAMKKANAKDLALLKQILEAV